MNYATFESEFAFGSVSLSHRKRNWGNSSSNFRPSSVRKEREIAPEGKHGPRAGGGRLRNGSRIGGIRAFDGELIMAYRDNCGSLTLFVIIFVIFAQFMRFGFEHHLANLFLGRDN